MCDAYELIIIQYKGKLQTKGIVQVKVTICFFEDFIAQVWYSFTEAILHAHSYSTKDCQF